MSAKRCIVIPAYNEAGQIASVIEGARKFGQADIVVIDDGSVDGTLDLARAAGVFVIRHPFNMGAGVATQTGYKFACKKGFETLLQLDGDGQHHPGHIPELFAMVEEGVCDLAIGSRFLQKCGHRTGFWKQAGIQLFRALIRMTTGKFITDPTSGYRCMNRRVFEYFTADSYPWDYPDANVLIDLLRRGFRIAELPVAMAPNPEGRSMHRGIFRISYYFFNMFFSILVILMRRKTG
ncbi:MAG: Undecaprenyl-phosphate mannosyltransferase [Deltaproteobacteria bacterium ADurb.Bin022]|nr:MAG: Undecaprenyl-phosphate mannosyltransferase [Deltaproteobacteria bacterium ADurb.Bin022]HOG82074.1 glycosyltransferase family 2 protein [Smithellaceae bacterium]